MYNLNKGKESGGNNARKGGQASKRRGCKKKNRKKGENKMKFDTKEQGEMFVAEQNIHGRVSAVWHGWVIIVRCAGCGDTYEYGNCNYCTVCGSEEIE